MSFFYCSSIDYHKQNTLLLRAYSNPTTLGGPMLTYIFISAMFVLFFILVNTLPSVRKEIGVIIFEFVFSYSLLRKMFPVKGKATVVGQDGEIISETTKSLLLEENPFLVENGEEKLFNESLRNGKLPQKQSECPVFNPAIHSLEQTEMEFSILGKNRGFTLTLTFMQNDLMVDVRPEAPTNPSIPAFSEEGEQSEVCLSEIPAVNTDSFSTELYAALSDIDESVQNVEQGPPGENLDENENTPENNNEMHFYILNISFTYPGVKNGEKNSIFMFELPLINYIPHDPNPDDAQWFSETNHNPEFPRVHNTHFITALYNEENEKVFTWDEAIYILLQLNIPPDTHPESNEIRNYIFSRNGDVVPLSIYQTGTALPEAPPGTNWFSDFKIYSDDEETVLYTAHILMQQTVNPYFYEYFESMITTT